MRQEILSKFIVFSDIDVISLTFALNQNSAKLIKLSDAV